jgi:hypothetical protein
MDSGYALGGVARAIGGPGRLRFGQQRNQGAAVAARRGHATQLLFRTVTAAPVPN